MYWYDYVLSLILPIILIIIGVVFWKHAPKKINPYAGWRTSQAMENQETWDFANAIAGKCTLILGIIEFFCTLILLFITSSLENIDSTLVPGLAIMQSACFVIVYIYVERKLKTHFDKHNF